MKKTRSWSHVFWVTNDETLVKKLFPVLYWNTNEKEENKKQQLRTQLQSFLRYVQTQ